MAAGTSADGRRSGSVDDAAVAAIDALAARRSPHVQELAIDQLRLAGSPRLEPEDPQHIRVLAQRLADLPPILVAAGTMQVIDGVHRVRAHLLVGRTTIPAYLFQGDEADSLVVSVRANVSHGKPLTLAEREEATRRILGVHPEWSDRAIAAVCGISPRTVSAIRQRIHAEAYLDRRIGRDGRLRPVDPAATRTRVAEYLRTNPGASLRSVAEELGTSVNTVRDVRQRMAQGVDPVPDRYRTSPEDVPPRTDWRDDSACSSTSIGVEFAAWFEAHRVNDDEWQAFVDGLPVSRLYLVADDARVCARSWSAFADALEQRVRREKSRR